MINNIDEKKPTTSTTESNKIEDDSNIHIDNTLDIRNKVYSKFVDLDIIPGLDDDQNVNIEPIPARMPSKCIQSIRNLVNLKTVPEVEKIFGNNSFDVEIPCKNLETDQIPFNTISDLQDLVHLKIANLDQLNLDLNN